MYNPIADCLTIIKWSINTNNKVMAKCVTISITLVGYSISKQKCNYFINLVTILVADLILPVFYEF